MNTWQTKTARLVLTFALCMTAVAFEIESVLGWCVMLYLPCEIVDTFVLLRHRAGLARFARGLTASNGAAA